MILVIYGTIIVVNLLIALTIEKVDMLMRQADTRIHEARIDTIQNNTFSEGFRHLLELFGRKPHSGILVHQDKNQAEPPQVRMYMKKFDLL